MAECKSVRFAKKKYRSYSKVITNFCDHFVFEFSLAYPWVGLKPFGLPAVEFFDKRVGFCWRVYKNLGIGFTCANLIMGPFTNTGGTTTPLTAFDEGDYILGSH